MDAKSAAALRDNVQGRHNNERRAAFDLGGDHFIVDHTGDTSHGFNTPEQVGQEAYPAHEAGQASEPGMRLARLNRAFNMEIAPWFQVARTVVLDGQNAQEITFPDGALFVMFHCSAQKDFFLQTKGSAEAFPVTGGKNINDGNNPQRDTGVINPVGVWLYCFGTKSVSVISQQAGTVVSAQFRIQSTQFDITERGLHERR